MSLDVTLELNDQVVVHEKIEGINLDVKTTEQIFVKEIEQGFLMAK